MTCEECGLELQTDDPFNVWVCQCYCDCGVLRSTCEFCVECPLCNQLDTVDDAGNCLVCGEVGIIEV